VGSTDELKGETVELRVALLNIRFLLLNNTCFTVEFWDSTIELAGGTI